MKELDTAQTNTVKVENSETEEVIPALNQKSKSLVLPVFDPAIDQMSKQIEVNGTSFDKKSETHVTAIGFTKGREVKEALKEIPELEAELNQIIAGLDWSHIILLPEKYHIRQDKEITRQVGKKEKRRMVNEGLEPVDTVTEVKHREAVIQMAEVPAIAELYERFRELGVDLGEAPPAHVTLYTSGDAGGIGIDSEADLQALAAEQVMLD